jgi:hypothetical protein
MEQAWPSMCQERSTDRILICHVRVNRSTSLASRIMCAIVYSYERRPSGPTDVLLNLSKFAISKDRIFFDNRLFTE